MTTKTDVHQDRLSVRHVSKSFTTSSGSVRALDDIAFDLGPEDFLGIVGPSGSGKSTLLRLIGGLDPDFEGDILFRGAPVSDPSRDRGLVFQEPRLFPWLTIRQNVAIGIHAMPEAQSRKRAEVSERLALVGLAGFEDMFPHQLSGGMQQRASIARALVARPQLLLLDEPFGALDAHTKILLQAELQRIRAANPLPTIIVTHDLEEAVFLCNRIIVLSARPGRIQCVVDVPLAHPRDRTDDRFTAIRRRLLGEFGLR